MNRRDILKSIPAVACAPVTVAAPAAAAADTQILRLFRQHRRIMDAAAAHDTGLLGRDEDEEMDHLFYRHSDKIEDEMMALPCTCAADFAAKVIVDTVKGGCFSDWETGALWIEARALIGGVA